MYLKSKTVLDSLIKREYGHFLRLLSVPIKGVWMFYVIKDFAAFLADISSMTITAIAYQVTCPAD